MREKIFGILYKLIFADNLATTWKIKCHKASNELEHLVNQEVEKRIAERIPSEMTLEDAEIAAKETDYACFAFEPEDNEINFADAAAFYLEGWNACRSSLTPQVTPQDTPQGEKTEG